MIIKRNKYLDNIRRFYDSNLIKVLTGVRRCGKSVLLNQIKEELINDRHIDKDHIISINFEDVQFVKIKNFNKLNQYILSKMEETDNDNSSTTTESSSTTTTNNKYYIFLDEIQHVNGFEKVLASLKATKNVSIFVTGSNSKLLSGRLASLLVGRCKEFKILPFSYSEFINYYIENGLEVPSKPLHNYIRYGGMPQRMDYSNNEEDIKEYLRSIYYGIIEKDICTSKSKINKEQFITISKYIITNASKEFSVSSIVDYYNRNNIISDSDGKGDIIITDNNVTTRDEKNNHNHQNQNQNQGSSNHQIIYRENVYRVVEKLEEACLISRVKRYDIPTKRNLKNIEKQFVVDNGFLLACNDSNKIFISHALENVVYNELVYRGYDVKIGKTYKGEIDFIAIKDSKKCFIQVAYLLSSNEVIEREFKAFDSVRDASPKYVFSLDEFDMSQDGITHLNIEDWLLNKVDINLS